MTVSELKELLSNFRDEDEIMISVPTGNYWGQVKAMPINDIEDDALVSYSSYLEEDKVHRETDDGVETDDNGVETVDGKPARRVCLITF